MTNFCAAYNCQLQLVQQRRRKKRRNKRSTRRMESAYLKGTEGEIRRGVRVKQSQRNSQRAATAALGKLQLREACVICYRAISVATSNEHVAAVAL